MLDKRSETHELQRKNHTLGQRSKFAMRGAAKSTSSRSGSRHTSAASPLLEAKHDINPDGCRVEVFRISKALPQIFNWNLRRSPLVWDGSVAFNHDLDAATETARSIISTETDATARQKQKLVSGDAC
jgi:predicted acylesterase/phospholipase RssA